DRNVAGLQPDVLALLGEARKLVTDALAARQALPELSVGRAVAQFAAAEQAVWLALELLQAIPHYAQEQRVGIEYPAFRAEFDECHGLAECLEDVLQLVAFLATAGEFTLDPGVKHGAILTVRGGAWMPGGHTRGSCRSSGRKSLAIGKG